MSRFSLSNKRGQAGSQSARFGHALLDSAIPAAAAGVVVPEAEEDGKGDRQREEGTIELILTMP
jgi:hypothetical protein